MNNPQILYEKIVLLSHDPFIKKHACPYARMSGSSTEVRPIQGWLSSIEISVKSNNPRYYKGWIRKQVENSNGYFSDGHFVKGDNTCPSMIILKTSAPAV